MSKKTEEFPIVPFHEKIVIKPFPPEDVSAGGIIIPDSVKERPSKGTVIAVGEGLVERPMKMKPGDVVYHIKGAGTLIQYEDEDYYIMIDKDCLAKAK